MSRKGQRTERQGQSPFVWSVLGGIAHSTNKLIVGTGVTCPTVRTHPTIIAQAAATVANMMPGRFFLGVGSGESLNEHIVAQGWPEVAVRQERLAEAIAILRLLWQGGLKSHHGKHFVVENARLYSLPERPPLEEVPCGPEPEKHIRVLRKYIDAGYDHICVHQVGPNQEQFLDFYAREVLPKL